MKCPKCDFKNPPDTLYCGKCAAPLHQNGPIGTSGPTGKKPTQGFGPTEEIPISPTKTLETPAKELTRGSTFAGRYEIIEELGKGGMGNVYRVEDRKIREEVALKLIKPEIAEDNRTV